MDILQYDETETGPRIRKTLADKVGVICTLEVEDIDGVATAYQTLPKIDLYHYTRPSNGQTVWLLEAQIYYPPDVILYRSWVLSARPRDDQARMLVSKGSISA